MSGRKFFLGCFLLGLVMIGGMRIHHAMPVRAAKLADCVWPNNTSGNWSDADTWSCAVVPGVGDTVAIGFGAAITLDTAEAIDSLTMTGGTISGSGSLSVNGAVRVYDTVTDVTISTNGSYFPELISSPYSGIVYITDPALAPGSLANVTINSPIGSNSSTLLDTNIHEISSLVLENGNLSWVGPLTVVDSLNWMNGGLGSSNSLTMTIGAAANVTISDGYHSIYSPLVNEGTISWTGTIGIDGFYPATFVNNGTLDLDVNGNPEVMFSGFAGFTNNGTFQRSGGSGTLYFSIPVINTGLFEISSGNVQFYNDFTQQDGRFQLNNATVQGNNQYTYLTFNGGELRGSGAITSTIRNEGGTLVPLGRLTIFGAYVQGAEAGLHITITGFTPASEFGVLTMIPNQGIGGGVTLDGRLIVDKAGGFAPASGDRFIIATCTTQCNGAFTAVSGSMSPAFSGFAGGGEIIVAEPANAALLQTKSDLRLSTQGSANGYTLNIFNPTTQMLTISSLSATLPFSFTYTAGSTSGALNSDPYDAPNGGFRTLYWPGLIQVPAGANASLHFGIQIAEAMLGGEYRIDWNANSSLGGQVNTIFIKNVAPIDLPLGAANQISLSGGVVVPNGQIPNIVLGRVGLDEAMISIMVHITCPFPAPCGNMSNVYVGQEVNGRGVTLFHLEAVTPAASEDPAAENYGFWRGLIPGTGVIPGVPLKIYPDWDAHRPCIAFDFIGTGIRPINCVGGGDPVGTPQLYDPSGIIRDSVTYAPIANATVTLYRIWNYFPDTRDLMRDCRTVDTRPAGVWSGQAPEIGMKEDANLFPMQIDPQVNPQVTGADGRYGWNVVTGCWYVKVTAPGYAAKISALVGVPPEVTDLDLFLDTLYLPYSLNLPLIGR